MNDTTTNDAPLSDDDQENHQRFLDEVKQSGLVWGLANEDGWAVCPSIEYEETDVFPFWSQEHFAQALCVEEWSVYQAKSISVEDFLIEWLPGMHEDDTLVGTNWDAELSGMEVEPADLAKSLGDE